MRMWEYQCSASRRHCCQANATPSPLTPCRGQFLHSRRHLLISRRFLLHWYCIHCCFSHMPPPAFGRSAADGEYYFSAPAAHLHAARDDDIIASCCACRRLRLLDIRYIIAAGHATVMRRSHTFRPGNGSFACSPDMLGFALVGLPFSPPPSARHDPESRLEGNDRDFSSDAARHFDAGSLIR